MVVLVYKSKGLGRLPKSNNSLSFYSRVMTQFNWVVYQARSQDFSWGWGGGGGGGGGVRLGSEDSKL